jgi:folate-binding protein YgfZ
MQPDWQQFLTAQGAIIEGSTVQHFGDVTAELTATAKQSVLCDLSQFATLRVSGEDAQSFLQNLLSNDICEVSATRAQFSSFNTAKGRMLATFLIWRDGEDFLLQLPNVLAEPLRKKLSMYVLRAKVKITGDEIISLGVSGPLPSSLKDCTELTPLGVSHIEKLATRVIRLSETHFMLCTTPTQAQTLWQILASEAMPVGSACWDWLNIRAGLPVILPQTQEQFVPQMVNFDLTGGINFKKGCYPGQEIVARMHYLGKLKRRMYLAHVESEIAPQPGDELYSEDMAGQASGMIANSAAAPNGGYDVLAVVQIASHDAYSVHLGSLQGAVLNFGALPYSLPAP